jgi:tetratricopeptide (TPR) repeat protein
MLVCALAFTALVDPKLGVRDWDLVAIFFVPLSVLAVWGASRRRLDDAPSVVLIAALVLLHAGTWIAGNADAARAAKVTIAWAESDARYTRPQAGGREDVTPFLKLASILERAGLEQQALHCARRSTEVSPASRESWLALGKMLRNAGSRDEAVTALRRAAALDPENYVPPYLAGLCLGEMGQFEEALAALEQALRLAPPAATAEVRAIRDECLRRAGR